MVRLFYILVPRIMMITKTYISLCSFRAHAMATIPSLESPDNNHFIAKHCVSSANKANDTSELGMSLFVKIYVSYSIESISSSTTVHVMLVCDLTSVRLIHAYHIFRTWHARRQHHQGFAEPLYSRGCYQAVDTCEAGHTAREVRET